MKFYGEMRLDDMDESEKETNEFFQRKEKKASRAIQLETTNMREGKRN